MRPQVTADSSHGLVVRLAHHAEVDPSFGLGPARHGAAQPPGYQRHRCTIGVVLLLMCALAHCVPPAVVALSETWLYHRVLFLHVASLDCDGH